MPFSMLRPLFIHERDIQQPAKSVDFRVSVSILDMFEFFLLIDTSEERIFGRQYAKGFPPSEL